MKKLIGIIAVLWSALGFAYPMPNPFPPFLIAQNLYYVGTDDLASYLVVTNQGNILINSDLEANVPMIKASIEKLGFKYSDTKILLISHAHLDHAAGSQKIKEDTGAQYMVMDADVEAVETGGKSDFHYGADTSMYFPKTVVDKVLHDGEKITLGDAVLTAHLTPGHTKGCTTWTMNLREKGKQYQVAIVGSLNLNPGYQLIDNKAYPKIAKDYKKAIQVVKSLQCDIFLGAHAQYFDLQNKYARLKEGAPNPFIDPVGCKNHVMQKEQEYLREFEKQRLAG